MNSYAATASGRAPARPHLKLQGLDLLLRAGAGDENRNRTISLGSAAVTAARGADQASLVVPSDRG